MRTRMLIGIALALTMAAPAAAEARGLPFPAPGVKDVNGDGRDDVLYWGDPARASQLVAPPFHARIVYGKADSGFVDVRDLGTHGYIADGWYSSGPVGAGDVNGDGRADFVADAGKPAPPGDIGAGFRSYGTDVVLGQAATGDVTPSGFRVRDSRSPFSGSVDVVDGIGDVNHDGYDDLAAYNRQWKAGLRHQKNTMYIVFGSAAPHDVDLAHLGNAGVRVRVPRQRRHSNHDELGLAGVGDVNGDGIADVAATVDWYPAASCGTAFNDEPRCDGRVWVIYGRRHLPQTIRVTRLGRHGMVVVANPGRARRNGRFYELWSAYAAGDIDGDGYGDMLVHADHGIHRIQAVIWGARSTRRQRRVTLSGRSARFPDAVAPIGDFDGDHRADLLGYPDQFDYETDRNRVYFLRGHRFSGWRGLTPGGGPNGHLLIADANQPVSGAGDVNGDGLADVLLPAEVGPDNPTTGAVIFGSPDPRPVDPNALGARGFRYGVP